MNKFNKIFLAALLLLPFSCYEPDDEELEKTEIGNDVFDIHVDGEHFTEGNSYDPSSLIIEDGKACFSLHGDLCGRNKAWDRKRTHHTLSITFPLDSMKIEKFSDVVALDQLDLDLKETNALVVWKQDFHTDTLDVKGGTLKFTRSRLIGIDGERNSVILAGDIDLSYNDTITREDSISKNRFEMNEVKGWFDVVIRRSNFEKR
ncbi:MAG: hypothetical protein IKN77_00825 [Paludibacteraceae bacterium]|nr:hypothetical protein [Paludibacteraceae bacterium]